jgi:hypothetical protein
MLPITQGFRAANALTGARRAKALHDMFDSLLWTAFVQVYRGRIPPLPSEFQIGRAYRLIQRRWTWRSNMGLETTMTGKSC